MPRLELQNAGQNRTRTISGKQTSKIAIEMLCRANAGFREVRGIEKTNLLTAFARRNKVLYGDAFDVVKCVKKFDFMNEDEIQRNLDSVYVYEVKATNRENVPEDFSGYFFDLTTAELLTAQSLGKQYKFVFVHTTRNSTKEMSVHEILVKTERIYPKWAVTFSKNRLH